jgi:hypothetical protein
MGTLFMKCVYKSTIIEMKVQILRLCVINLCGQSCYLSSMFFKTVVVVVVIICNMFKTAPMLYSLDTDSDRFQEFNSTKDEDIYF